MRHHRQKVFKGRLRGLQDGKIRLELPTGDFLDIPLDVVNQANLEFDWEEEKARNKDQREPERGAPDARDSD